METTVIKIGTSILRGNTKYVTGNIIDVFCKYIAEYINKGNKVIIVSSGSVGLGCGKLEIKERPIEVVALQAVAAVGQGYLMSLYESSMKKYGINVGQILLTRSELGNRRSYISASSTLKKLLDWNVVPIVNENDTISSEELKYGDNDTLSALVACAVSSKQLILLTDIESLYSSDPKIDKAAKPIFDIHNPTDLNKFNNTSNIKSNWGTGGIKTKLQAAKIATERGIKVHLSDGRDPKNLEKILCGMRVGTVFHPSLSPIKNRKSWLANALKPLGSITLDDGAKKAVLKNGASLLLVGIMKVEGEFDSNNSVKLLDTNSLEIGIGISSLSSLEIRKSLNNRLLSKKSPVVIHRDVLTLSTGLS